MKPKEGQAQNRRYFKTIEEKEQFVLGKYYAVLDSLTLEQRDCFLCNNVESASKKLDFYRGRCLIVEHLTEKEIEDSINHLRGENNAEYWRFVRAAHSKSTAPLMRCVELQRERGALEKWLNSKRKKGCG